MVIVNYSGGLGENLFQYCFGRILAERFGYAFRASPIWGFPNTLDHVGGETILSPTVTWTGAAARDWRTGERIPDSGLRTAPGVRMSLNGWFQRLEYYEDHIDEIRNAWLKNDFTPETRREDDLAVCIRFRNTAHWQLTDDDHLMTFPAPVYHRPSRRDLQNLVDVVPHSQLHIITDTPTASLFNHFREVAEFHHMGDWEDFRFACSFNKLAFAATAFDWWAAVFSNAKETYALPSRRELMRQRRRRKGDFHSGFTDTDLRFPFDGAIGDWN